MITQHDQEQGYKQYERRKMTFATGVKSKIWEYKYDAEDPNFPEIPKIIPGRKPA